MNSDYKISNIMEWYKNMMDKQGNFLIDSCILKKNHIANTIYLHYLTFLLFYII